MTAGQVQGQSGWIDEALREHEELAEAPEAAGRRQLPLADREQQVLDRIDRARRRRPRVREERITMSHGAGGKATQTLIEAVFLDAFRNPLLEPLEDAAQLMLGGSRVALTTDSYVVKPLFFPGGDIGDLAVNGTVNDLAVSGATPLFLSACCFSFRLGSSWKRASRRQRQSLARAGECRSCGAAQLCCRRLWEARLPWSLAMVGVPRGWSDENHWSWTGFSWKRGPGKTRPDSTSGLWEPVARHRPSTISPHRALTLSDRYLFSRRGEPRALGVWLVPGSWLVGICSGLTLVIGFLAIFRKLRFRTIWLGFAGVAVLSAALVEPAVTFLVLQAAALGARARASGVRDRALDRARECQLFEVAAARSTRLPGR